MRCQIYSKFLSKIHVNSRNHQSKNHRRFTPRGGDGGLTDKPPVEIKFIFVVEL